MNMDSINELSKEIFINNFKNIFENEYQAFYIVTASVTHFAGDNVSLEARQR